MREQGSVTGSLALTRQTSGPLPPAPEQQSMSACPRDTARHAQLLSLELTDKSHLHTKCPLTEGAIQIKITVQGIKTSFPIPETGNEQHQ